MQLTLAGLQPLMPVKDEMNSRSSNHVPPRFQQCPRLARSYGEIGGASARPTLRKANSNVAEWGNGTSSRIERLQTLAGSTDSFQTVFVSPQALTASSEDFDFRNLPFYKAKDEPKSSEEQGVSVEKTVYVPTSCSRNESNLFGRWLSTIRRRNRPAELQPPLQQRTVDRRYGTIESGNMHHRSDRRSNKFSTPHSSSNGLIDNVKSVTITLDSTSIRPQSWLGNRIDNLKRGSLLRSARSFVEYEDSFDAAAQARSIQRRKILEEIVDSEESYVADLKVLANVLFNVLLSTTSFSVQFRASMRENITQLILLHETLLGGLHASIPHSEYSGYFAQELPDVAFRGHTRWRSADGTPSYRKQTQLRRKARHSVDLPMLAADVPVAITADADIGLGVAQIFEHSMKSFFLYEEYSAMFDMLVQQLNGTYSNQESRESCERGLEILSRSLEATKLRPDGNKKGLTLNDLVIKPIQRICKYPLLLSDLLKHTPIADDPVARAEIEKVHSRLQEIVEEVNKAKDDPHKRTIMQRTWCLYSLLERADPISQQLVHATTGQLRLCGALFVTYQSGSGPKGQYMMCALFKTCLVIATPDKSMTKFSIVALIYLSKISLARADDGDGLLCYNAPFTWKIVFESNQSLFELMFSACSADEERQWLSLLGRYSDSEKTFSIINSSNHFGTSLRLGLDIKPLRSISRSSETVPNNISNGLGATLELGSQIDRIILKNTASTQYTVRTSSEDNFPIGRSQSERRSPYISVLAPRRLERIRLEQALSDVWTKELLPFPAMKQNRGDNPFRMSAESVKRMFSVSSLASSFTRRAASNPGQPRAKTPTVREPLEFGIPLPRKRPSPTRPGNTPPVSSETPSFGKQALENSVVNFHDAPEKFLPPDFALPVSRPRKLIKAAPSTIRTVSDENRQDRATNPKRNECNGKFRIPSSSGTRSRSVTPVSISMHAKIPMRQSTDVLKTNNGLENDVSVSRSNWRAAKSLMARSDSQDPALGRTARLRKKIFP